MHFLLTKKLKYFIKVMEQGCLTKASEELFITRSPLGKTINELETLLGQQLFFRKHGLFKPTDYALSIYNKIEPLYSTILDLENQFSNNKNTHRVSVILDDMFPETFADLIECGMKKNCQNFKFHRKLITQETLTSLTPGSNTLIVTTKPLHHPDQIKMISFNSSSLLILTNAELKDDVEKLIATPLLLREKANYHAASQMNIRLDRDVSFTPKLLPTNGNIADFLMMASQGIGFMLLPLKTCQALSISRENTILINELTFKINFYHAKNASKPESMKIIKDYIKSII